MRRRRKKGGSRPLDPSLPWRPPDGESINGREKEAANLQLAGYTTAAVAAASSLLRIEPKACALTSKGELAGSRVTVH